MGIGASFVGEEDEGVGFGGDGSCGSEEGGLERCNWRSSWVVGSNWC